MQNYSTGAKYVYYWIDKNHNLWCSGRQGVAYGGNYNESDTTASAGWTIPLILNMVVCEKESILFNVDQWVAMRGGQEPIKEGYLHGADLIIVI